MKRILVKIHEWFKPLLYIITLFVGLISAIFLFSQLNIYLRSSPNIPEYSTTATSICFFIVILYWSAVGLYLIMKSVEKKYGIGKK